MKIPFAISAVASGQKASVRITGHIGWETDSENFRKQVDDIIASGITEADIYINSPGGSVFDANEIVNILSRFKVRNCTGGALVASAASYIACACDTFEMPENGMLMIHRPSGYAGGKIEDFQSYIKLLKDVEKSYKALYLSKAKDKQAFIKAWDESDYWLTAKEAVQQGFATSVKQKITYSKEMTDLLVASGCPQNIYNNIISSQTFQKTKKMDLLSFFRNLFGLSDSATEQDAISSVTSLQNENKTLKSEKAALEARLTEIEKKSKQDQSAEAKAILDAAVLDGRINADTRKTYENLFASNHEDAKAVVNSLPKRKPVAPNLEGSKPPVSKFDKTWDELDKAGLLVALKAEDPELYKDKFRERFGVEPTMS